MLEMDSTSGKQPLRLTNVLLIETMDFNIPILQNLRAVGPIPVYAEMEWKVIIKKWLSTSGMEKVALLYET